MKLSEWRLKMTENVQDKLDKLNGVAEKVRSRFMRIQDNINGVREKIQGMISEIPGVDRALSLLKNPIALIAAAGIAIGGLGVKATQMAFNFEEGVAKINATAQLTKEQLGGLRTELMEIGKESGGNFSRIPDSFEKILSQNGNVNDSLKILKASVQGAKAGFTDLDVVASALAQTMSIVGSKNANAQEVLDTFMAAKRVGAGEFQDFATYIPTLIAAGKNLGMQYKDVAGVFAFMTGKGQDVASASMLMQNAFSALGKGEIVKGLKGIGVNVFDKKGAMRDIGEIMTDMNKRLGGLSDEKKSSILEKIGLRDVQAKNAISILMSDTQKLKEALDSTANSAGETANAIANTANPGRAWADVLDKVNFILTRIGYVIMPVVTSVLNFFNKALGWLIDNKDIVLGFLAGWAAGILIVAIAKGTLTTVLGFLTTAVWANTIAWLANPMVWIPLVVAAVVASFMYMWNKFEAFRGFLYGLWEAFKEVFSALWDVAKNVFGGLGKLIWGVITFDKDMIKSGLNSMEKGWDNVTQIGERVGNKFRAGYEKGASQVRENLESEKQKKTAGGIPGLPDPPPPPGGPAGGKGKDDGKVKNGIDSISGGGSQQKIINVNINKFGGDVTLHAANVKEGANEVGNIFMEMLVRVLNGSVEAMANQ